MLRYVGLIPTMRFIGEDNAIIYIAGTDFVKLMCHAREARGKRIFFGGLYCREIGIGNLLGQVSLNNEIF